MRRYVPLVALLISGCGSTTTSTRTMTRPLTVPAHVATVRSTTGPEAPTATSCGRERWDVKTLSDPAAATVDLAPRKTTVDNLVTTQPPPVSLGLDAARQSAERATYTVHAMLTLAKIEADSDFHLVLADTDGKTMIAEIPDPACATGSRVLEQITASRSGFVRMFGTPSPSIHPNAMVTITGVLFFDAYGHGHNPTGAAPIGNGEAVELHPVLAVSSP